MEVMLVWRKQAALQPKTKLLGSPDISCTTSSLQETSVVIFWPVTYKQIMHKRCTVTTAFGFDIGYGVHSHQSHLIKRCIIIKRL